MRTKTTICALAALVLGLTASWPLSVAAKRASVEPRVPTLPTTLKKSRSVGLAWKGRLERGVRVTPNQHLRYVTEYAKVEHFYGTWQLVQLIERAAQRVALRVPGAKLSLGELSDRSGGDLPGHASHESGRDADLGFYMLDAKGKPYDAYAFASFDERGQGLAPNLGMRFDTRRNWELIARLVSDAEARVQFAFVAPGIKQLLLNEGKRVGASRVVLDRAARVMVRPHEKHLHGNHFHVRIYCSPSERPKCVDQPPYWPWYPRPSPRLSDPL